MQLGTVSDALVMITMGFPGVADLLLVLVASPLGFLWSGNDVSEA